MSMAPKQLRVTRDRDEIRSFFREYIRLKCPVLLWQKHDDLSNDQTKRNIFSGQFVFINEEKGFILLSYKNEEELPEIDFTLSSTLYIRGTIQSILFKIEVTHHADGKILLQIHNEERVCEKRYKARHKYGYVSEDKI